MTPLDWIKRLNNHPSPLISSQVRGLTVLLVIGTAACILAAVFHWDNPRTEPVPWSDPTQGTVAVELSGAVTGPGVYYVPSNATVASFVRLVGVVPEAYETAGLPERRLSAGTVVRIDANGRVTLGAMTAAKRLALDLPVDINAATHEDLILIPGVKEKTAAKILALREQSGGRIARMEDLMQIRGIKEKRLAHLKRYLYVP